MNKSNLVQKQITDKNGVTGYRWVKRDNGASRLLRKITPPSVASPVDAPASAMERALDAFSDDGETLGEKAYQNLWFLAQHAPECLDRLLDQSSENAQLQALWKHKVNAAVLHPMKQNERDREQHKQSWERMLDLYPMSHELINATGDSEGDDRRLRDYTLSIESKVHDLLQWGTNTLNRDATEKPDPEIAKALALVCIVRGTYDEFCWRIPNLRLQYSDIADDTEFISKHVDRVQRLVPELIARRSHDTELIQTMLEGPSSLAEGVL